MNFILVALRSFKHQRTLKYKMKLKWKHFNVVCLRNSKRTSDKCFKYIKFSTFSGETSNSSVKKYRARQEILDNTEYVDFFYEIYIHMRMTESISTHLEQRNTTLFSYYKTIIGFSLKGLTLTIWKIKEKDILLMNHTFFYLHLFHFCI